MNNSKCTIEEFHCHAKHEECIAFIDDCLEHWETCFDGCHEEHGCMNP